MRRSLATLLAAAALLADGAVAARYVSDDLADSLDEYSQAWADAIEAAYERRVKPDDRRDPAASASSHSYSFTTTRKPATTKPTVKPPPATKAPLVEPSVAPMIPAEALSADTVAPATVKPADDDSDDEHTVVPAPAATAPHDEEGDMAKPASTTTSPSLTVENDDDSDSGKGGCPKYNEISSACGSVCPNNALCIKYRAGGECTSTNISTCVRPKADGCAYECLEGTSVDFDQWYISPYGVPAWNTMLHNNQQIEAMRSVDVPRNITQLSLQFVFNELDGMNVKGKVATLEFPDKRIVSNSSTLSSIAIVNLDYRKLPPAAFTPQLQYLVLENCLLTSVPDAVLGLKQLNFLNLASNTIQKLPSNLAQLPLTALYMDSNEVTEFPAFVAQMSSLKVVSFVDNNLTKFTTESRTSAMTELALDYNQLTDFAGNIPSLHNLFLRGNRLTGFPSTLASLTNLEVLDLTENALSSQAIEEAANKLTHPYLRELMLGSNGLHKVPDLGNVFPVLKTLWVRNNSIEKVEGTYSGKLEVLNALSNKIKSFKASFSRLNVLDLTDNKLESLPDVASISSVLQSLNVSKNDLETLSDSKPLTTLTAFNASTNSLSSFSLTIPGLRSLDLSNNKLKSIPDAVWTYNVLDELHLDGNPKLENVELSRDQHSFLKRLSVFTMDASAMRHDCPEDWKTDLKGVTICVTNGAEDKVVLKSSGSDSQPWTWVSIALGAVAAFALVAFLFVVRRRRRQYEGGDYKHDEFGITTLKKEENTAGLTQTMGFSSLVRSYPNGGIWDDEELQDRRVDYDSIKLESRLASGAYGEVWIGTYRLECVAVKKLSDAGMRDKNAVSYFVSEIKLLAQLDHPRIIRFYGVAWTCLTDLCAVIEYMPGGDLHSLLRSHLLPSNRWNATKLQIALDTVEALTYVHTLDDVLIHRDLKSRNVLLDDDWRAKVTDFGISRFQRESDATMTSGVGTGRWMAPEVIMGRADYNEKVDIYSFGVILSELDTHQMPYENSTDKQLPLSEMGILQQVAAGELRPSFSRTCPPSIMEIAQKCLAFRPEDRPSSLELAYQLRQLIPMFPREEAARPSSVFSRGTFSMTTNPFRKSAAANTNWRPGSEIMLRSSGQSGEFSL